MSNPVADEPEVGAPAAPTAVAVSPGVGAADGPPVGRPSAGGAPPSAKDATDGAEARDRSQTTADASARDWADTGDPGHEPVLPPEHPDHVPGTPEPPGTPVARAPETSPPATSPPAGPPPVTGPAAPVEAGPAEPGPREVVRATGPPRRPPLLLQGLWPALLAVALAGCASLGLLPLAVAVLALQVFLVLGTLALLDAPAAGGAFLVATGTVVAADLLVLSGDGRVTGLAGAAALGLVASLVHQLARKGRSRVTESLADTLVVIVVAVAAACLLALHQVDGGRDVLLAALAATGAVLLAGRVGDRLRPRPVLAVGSTRGWPGLLLGLVAGVAAALVAAAVGGELALPAAALLGLVVASTVATADLAVDLGAAELRAGWRDARRVAALRPTALLLPYSVLGPVALLAGRLVLG